MSRFFERPNVRQKNIFYTIAIVFSDPDDVCVSVALRQTHYASRFEAIEHSNSK